MGRGSRSSHRSQEERLQAAFNGLVELTAAGEQGKAALQAYKQGLSKKHGDFPGSWSPKRCAQVWQIQPVLARAVTCAPLTHAPCALVPRHRTTQLAGRRESLEVLPAPPAAETGCGARGAGGLLQRRNLQMPLIGLKNKAEDLGAGRTRAVSSPPTAATGTRWARGLSSSDTGGCSEPCAASWPLCLSWRPGAQRGAWEQLGGQCLSLRAEKKEDEGEQRAREAGLARGPPFSPPSACHN